MNPVLLGSLAVVSGPLFVIDVREHRLPNRWNAALAATGILIHAVGAITARDARPLVAAVVCGVVGLLGMAALRLVVRGGLGLGDVKLVAALGCVFADEFALLATVVIAFVSAAVWSLPQLLVGRYRLGSRLAFGPFILLGAWVVIAVGLVRG